MENVEKSGQIFIAYKGQEYDRNDIYRVLGRNCPSGYTVKDKYDSKNHVIFAKVVYNNYTEDSDPYYKVDTGILSVNGYNQNEVERACRSCSCYGLNDADGYQRITNFLYGDNRENMFKILSQCMHFCSVIYDINRGSIVAGVTEPNSKYTYLYYGYTNMNHELMFSNDETTLKQLCNEVYEMDENTYMKDGELYTLDGEKYEKVKNPDSTKKTKQNADLIIDGLNALLVQVTSELLDEKLKEYVSKIEAPVVHPVVHIIKLRDTVLGQTKGGFYHEKFEQILSQVQLDEPIMLIGPAGSGKNVAVSQVADALGQHMYYTNNASNEFKLTGFIDAGGNYRDTEFYKAFKNGGIFFLDDIDNSDPSALIVINSALANGYMAFPHETIDRHPDFRIIAAANTWGKGADLQYVGRNALDGATLDRFDNIFFDYDTNLERALYPNDEVLQFMWAFRNAVYQSKIPHIVSTRGIGKVYKKEINGIPVQDTLTSNVVKNLGQDDVNTIIGNMQNVSSNNKYYDGIKRLRLSR